MNNKATTVCFSGHRVFQDPTADIEKKLDKAVRDCISKGAECFITGGALGFDTLAARTVIRLREEFPHIKLILALPCPPQAQTLKWSAPQVAEYREILGLADDVTRLAVSFQLWSITICTDKIEGAFTSTERKNICSSTTEALPAAKCA